MRNKASLILVGDKRLKRRQDGDKAKLILEETRREDAARSRREDK